MLKKNAFQIAVIYGQKISTQEMHIATARALRDLMKPYMDFAAVFESDRNTILTNDKLTDEGKQKEFEVLQNEDSKLKPLSDKLIKMAEEAGLKLSPAEIGALYCYESEKK